MQLSVVDVQELTKSSRPMFLCWLVDSVDIAWLLDVVRKRARTSETLNHHLHAAVHRHAAIFDLFQGFDHILLP